MAHAPAGAPQILIDLSQFRSGFCDRLRLATWAMAVARLRGQSQLIIKDGATPYCPYLFSELCQVRGLHIVPWQESFGPPGAIRMSPKVFPGNAGHAGRLRPPDIQLSPRAFQSLWLDAYTRLQPQPSLGEALSRLDLGPDCLGLHLRYTDKIRQLARGWMEIEVAQLPLLESTTLRLLQRCKATRIFVACDSAEQKLHWCDRLRQLGYTVLSHRAHFDSSQHRQTNAHDFGVDLFALAACRRLLGTTRSGVVHTANWIHGGRRQATFAVDSMLWPMLRRRVGQWLQLR